MNSIDQRLKNLVVRAQRAIVPDELQPREDFASKVFAQVAMLQDPFAPPKPLRRLSFFTFVDQWSSPEELSLWMRFSLASLPIGATVMIACLLWSGAGFSHDVEDLASSFVQSQLLP